MSAKGRREGGSVPFDYYPTPAWCVDRLLDDCGHHLLRGFYRGKVHALEPTVGDGAIVRAVNAWNVANTATSIAWTGVELRMGASEPGVVDYLYEGADFRAWAAPKWDGAFDLAIGNPPYALAEPIIRAALKTADAAAMLLRVGFLGSAERVPFWQEYGDVALRVLPDRPSFDGGGTDSATYAWFVWGCPGVTGVKVLEPTPASVRSAQELEAQHALDEALDALEALL